MSATTKKPTTTYITTPNRSAEFFTTCALNYASSARHGAPPSCLAIALSEKSHTSPVTSGWRDASSSAKSLSRKSAQHSASGLAAWSSEAKLMHESRSPTRRA